jgi:hypothetical protein
MGGGGSLYDDWSVCVLDNRFSPFLSFAAFGHFVEFSDDPITSYATYLSIF